MHHWTHWLVQIEDGSGNLVARSPPGPLGLQLHTKIFKLPSEEPSILVVMKGETKIICRSCFKINFPVCSMFPQCMRWVDSLYWIQVLFVWEKKVASRHSIANNSHYMWYHSGVEWNLQDKHIEYDLWCLILSRLLTSLCKSALKQVARVRVRNYIKFKTGQNLPPVLKKLLGSCA